MLDQATRLGVSGVEVNTGGWSTAPHFNLAGMKTSATARKRFLKAFAGRNLDVTSLNANGNPLHPTDKAQGECLQDTIRLAGEMGIKTVCTMSGLPAGSAGDKKPNWVVSSWPPETQAILNYQWNEVLLPFWHAGVMLNSLEGLEKSVVLLNSVMPRKASDYKPQAT